MSNSLTRRDFIARAGMAAAGLALGPRVFAGEAKRPNILFITADDLGIESLGCTGSKTPDISPNLDRLASEGMRFEHGHVTIAVCQPSRSVMMTGRYPHRNGAVGFGPINDVPTLGESLRAAGYLNGIMSKVDHLTPQPKYCWDVVVREKELGFGRNPDLYYQRSKEFFDKAKADGKPFFLMANSQDPHRPFPGDVYEKVDWKDQIPAVRRRYKPAEVETPAWLPDLPDIRKETAMYYTAVHRLDETVGQLLRALKESGQEDNTFVMFLSDNGVSLPFAKCDCYEASTNAVWMVRWPGKVKPGVVNHDDFISTIDFMPTVLDVCGIAQVSGMDGRSFLPIIRGRKQDGRDRVFTVFNETNSNGFYPMRCLRTKKCSYIVNGWADGKMKYYAEPMNGFTFAAMRTASETDPKLAERVRFNLYRAPEEFYDLESDPYEMKNLIGDPKYKATIEDMRAQALKMMIDTRDPKRGICARMMGLGRAGT
jgi:N-sulfoglucosamine sulfohydrolase